VRFSKKSLTEPSDIQRRLVKSMEDAKIYYDFTVRNVNGTIIQFIYGDDGMDGAKIELQDVPIVGMDLMEIYKHYQFTADDMLLHIHMTKEAMDKSVKELPKCDELMKQMVEDKEFLLKVFKYEKRTKINYPIPFERIIGNAINRRDSCGIKGVKSNLDVKYIIDKIDELISAYNVKGLGQGTRFFEILCRIYLNPKKLIINHHITREMFDWIIEEVKTYFKKSVALPGEMVGIMAAQTIGEMGTQMTLDSFHQSGTAAAVKATSGVPRLKELLSVSKNIKTPTMMIYLKDDIAKVKNPSAEEGGADRPDSRIEETKLKAMAVKNQLEITRICDIIDYTEVFWDKKGLDTYCKEDQGVLNVYKEFEMVDEKCNKSESNWVIRMKLNKEKMKMHGLRMIDIYTKINTNYENMLECVFSDDNADECIMRIKLTAKALQDISNTDVIAALKAMEYNIVYNVLLKGVKGIKKVSLNKSTVEYYDPVEGKFDQVHEWALDTDGTNLNNILANENIDATRTRSNDIREIYEVLGIEAARQALNIELENVIGDGAMNYRHLSMLTDTMTMKGTLMSIDRHGINRGDVGPLAKSSFEETTDMLINASIFSEYDKINGVSANVMLGQQPPCGTGDCEILLDEKLFGELMKDMSKSDLSKIIEETDVSEIEIENNVCDNIAFEYKLPEKKNKCKM
jgi:DNA-directed RNA polymerase II subunit RPB1